MNVKEININDIKIIENVRIKIEKLEGLMQDIKQNGLYNPIKVAKTKTSEYVLVQGNRRLAACKKLGWKKIPATVSEDIALADLLLNNMSENIHREDISPFELGRICSRLEKELDMTRAEISARLSTPPGRIKDAIQSFNNLPTKYRHKVSYVGGGNSRNGNIPASVAAKVIACKRQYGLSDAGVDKLMNVAKKEDFGVAELFIISILLEQGLSVTDAIEMCKKYKYLRFDIPINHDEVETLLDKYKLDSAQVLIKAIVFGELPPLKRPAWFKITQVPAK